jgi:hypothetical protein
VFTSELIGYPPDLPPRVALRCSYAVVKGIAEIYSRSLALLLERVRRVDE